MVDLLHNTSTLEKAGGWLFRQRSWLPLPIVAALLLIPAGDPGRLDRVLFWLGVTVVLAGELLRLWAVHHIGVISRTRSDRLGPLIDTGPFSLVRNPLYLGNICLWVGFALSARLTWLAPVVALLLTAEYHAIVSWEERLLRSRLGAGYADYLSRVPRWIPAIRRPARPPGGVPFSWRDTLFSERSTILAIVLGYLLLGVKPWLVGGA